MNESRQLRLDHLGYGVPVSPQKPVQNGDKSIERKALAPSQPQPNHQENNIMENNNTNQPHVHNTAAAPEVPPVPEMKTEVNTEDKKEQGLAMKRVKSFGSVALEATGENAVKPLVQGFCAAAGALVAFKAGKKLGWL